MQIIDIKAKISKNKVSLLYQGKAFLIMNREAFASLVSVSENIATEEDTEINGLIATYDRYKSKFYKRNVTKSITKSNKDYKYFREALAIIKRHGVESRTYIEAQMKGLEFANTFPKPSQLSTTGAEERLLDYLRTVDVEGTQEQQEQDADTYKAYFKKIKDGTATIKEAKYAARYEKKTQGDIKSSTRAFLSFLKNQ